MWKCLIKFVRRTTWKSHSWIHGEVCEGEKKLWEPSIYDIQGYYFFPLYQQSPLIYPPTHPLSFSLSFSSPLPPSSFPLFFVQRDWLLGPAPGAETLANSVALHCVGWKKRPSCEVSVRPRLINEQTGRQSGPSLVFLSWINEAFLKDTPHCSSHWSNIPQHLTLPNFL